MANHVPRRRAVVRYPEPDFAEGRLDQAGCPRDGHQSQDRSQDARSPVAEAVRAEEPEVSEAWSAYRLDPAPAPGKCDFAAPGPALLKAIHERIRDEEGFRGSYGSVKDYAHPIAADSGCIWEYAYDLLVSLERSRAVDFLFLLSRADPPVISLRRTERFFRDAGRVVSAAPKPDRRAQAQQAAFDWMRAILQKDIGPDALRRDVGDVPDLGALLHGLYDGRLSDRNRSMAILADRHGLGAGMVCRFLGIDSKAHRKYLRTFEEGGQTALFARQTKSTRKFDSEALKQAVFRLLHEPPSNHGINRTTWIMPDLSRVLRETGHPACPAVIRKITKAAGYRWRKARVVLTSSDPDYTEKLDRIRSILSGLRPDEAFFSTDEFGPFAVKMQPGRALSAPGEQRVVPQWQRSRGCLILTAALELSGNQVIGSLLNLGVASAMGPSEGPADDRLSALSAGTGTARGVRGGV
jgi:hypothetical protein